MGTFVGHFFSGIIFAALSLWWLINISWRYHRKQHRPGVIYRNSFTFPVKLHRRCVPWQIEGYFKIICTGISATIELVMGAFYRDGRLAIHAGNVQHATMYGFFCLSGMLDIALHHKVPIPKHFDYLFTCVCFAVEAVLMSSHVMWRDPMDTQIHANLTYVIIGCIVCLLLDMHFSESVYCALGKVYFTMIQGTWLMHAGFILYNPVPGAEPWHHDDPDEQRLTSTLFVLHLALAFIIIIAIFLLTEFIFRRTKPTILRDPEMSMELLNQDD